MLAALKVLLPVFLEDSDDSNHNFSGLCVCNFGCFLSYIDLMIQFLNLIDRVLSPFTLMKNFFISC